MKLQVECKVEPTKSEKWIRLAPTQDNPPIGPVNVRADQMLNHAARRVTITIAD